MRPVAYKEIPHPNPLPSQGEREKRAQSEDILYSATGNGVIGEISAVGKTCTAFGNSKCARGLSLSSSGGEGRGEEASCFLSVLVRNVTGSSWG